MSSSSVNLSQLKRKRRRNSSPQKQEDDSNFAVNSETKKKISQILTNQNDPNIAFISRLLRVTKDLKLVQYQLVITDKNLYLFKDKSGKLKDSISLNLIKAICLSHQSDNFMIIKTKGEQDVILVSSQKIKITEILMQQSLNENSAIPLSIMDRFSFTLQKKKYVIIFTREKEYGVRISIYADKQQERANVSPKKKSK